MTERLAMPALPRAILFDMDDTILSAYGRPFEVWEQAAEPYTADLAPLTPAQFAVAVEKRSQTFWNDQDWNRIWRVRLIEGRRQIVAHALADLAASGHNVLPAVLGDAIADHFAELREAAYRVFPGAHETLDRLKELGVQLALITNGAAEPQRAKVVRFALEHRFDHIQIEGEHGFGKPEERAYTHAMAVLGVGPHETWMVGDNLEWEVAAPQRLGIHAIWCDSYAAGLPPDSPIRPDRIIRSLSELLG